MAKSAPSQVLVAKQVKDGLTKEEEEEYRVTFKKFDTDSGGTIDAKELGKLVRVLGCVYTYSILQASLGCAGWIHQMKK